jgi:MinD superfamily P-loop ATPase
MKIAIASGKGGTGKTSLATNLASFLSKSREVVLVDMDVEEPNAGIFIKGRFLSSVNRYKAVPQWEREKCEFCGKCQEVCNFHAIIQLPDEITIFPNLCHSCYACAELCPVSAISMVKSRTGTSATFLAKNIRLIENRLDVGEEQAVPLISASLEEIDEQYGHDAIVIMDAPPGTSCPFIEVVADADLVILVSEPTPFGLHDLKLALETLDVVNGNYVVVLNRYGTGNKEVELFCEAKKIPLIAKIPHSRKAAELCSRGRLIYAEIAEIGREIEKVAAYVLSRKTK